MLIPTGRYSTSSPPGSKRAVENIFWNIPEGIKEGLIKLNKVFRGKT